jgi:hypothetical protein
MWSNKFKQKSKEFWLFSWCFLMFASLKSFSICKMGISRRIKFISYFKVSNVDNEIILSFQIIMERIYSPNNKVELKWPQRFDLYWWERLRDMATSKNNLSWTKRKERGVNGPNIKYGSKRKIEREVETQRERERGGGDQVRQWEKEYL